MFCKGMRTDMGDFPISPLNPLIVTRVVDGKIFQRAYTFSAKAELEAFVEDNLVFDDGRTLIGVWKGEWRSDVFELDFNTIIPKVIAFGRNYKTFKY